jgi:hypothetical protein
MKALRWLAIGRVVKALAATTPAAEVHDRCDHEHQDDHPADDPEHGVAASMGRCEHHRRRRRRRLGGQKSSHRIIMKIGWLVVVSVKVISP